MSAIKCSSAVNTQTRCYHSAPAHYFSVTSRSVRSGPNRQTQRIAAKQRAWYEPAPAMIKVYMTDMLCVQPDWQH